jgi:hypothetical protein
MLSETIGPQGEIALPLQLRQRYGLNSETPVRTIETRSGILLVPLMDAPMDMELSKELADWQSLSASTWKAYA